MNDLSLPLLLAAQPSELPPSPPPLKPDAAGAALPFPDGACWGAQTQRNLHRFDIGEQRMPTEVIRALALIKWAAALANRELGRLGNAQAAAIAQAASRVAEGEFDNQFPLSVWQTGSGSQSDANVNEVVANIASQSLRSSAGLQPVGAPLVDAEEHVNLGQSACGVFPSAMHIAALLQAKSRLLPALQGLRSAMAAQGAALVQLPQADGCASAPVSLAQVFDGYEAKLAMCEDAIRRALPPVHGLALGGAAEGCGNGSQPAFGARVIDRLAQRLQLPLMQADALLATGAGHEPLVALHGALRMLAIALTQVAHGMRCLNGSPGGWPPGLTTACPLQPLHAAQTEALVMVCVQVLGHDSAIGFAASQGQMQVHVYRPLIALNVLGSGRLLADAMRSLTCPEPEIAGPA